MMIWFVAGIVLIALFIAVDVLKGIKSSTIPVVQTEIMKVENEKIVKVEAEVEAKMKELQRHQSERMIRHPQALAVKMPAPASDPMNDTRCMAAVKEKAEEIDRLSKEKGLKS
jgi:uncharacterized membrane protein YhiD involved in acid resistance